MAADLLSLNDSLREAMRDVVREELKRHSGNGQADDRLLDANEVAERLHVPVSWVREATREGRLPFAVQLGRYWRYDAAGIQPWLEQQKRRALANGGDA